MSGYSIVNHQKIEEHITFIRINPNDIALTLKEVFASLSDLSWIDRFDKDYIQQSFQVRAESTIQYIAANIIKSTDDSVTSNSGEYIVSELARKTIVKELEYLDIPLAELIKKQKSGNPGFDFYSRNKTKILLFGEAKYLSAQNAYGSALEQIVRFENEKSDLADLADIERFCCNESLENFTKNKKGYIAAFASKTITTDNLIKNIKANEHFQALSKFSELICVAVDL